MPKGHTKHEYKLKAQMLCVFTLKICAKDCRTCEAQNISCVQSHKDVKE
jgi:hypothetical protein